MSVSDEKREHLKRIAHLGGKATAEKYGSDYMAEIGKMGAEAFHRKYRLHPVGIGDFAIVDRITNKVVNTIYGAPFQ